MRDTSYETLQGAQEIQINLGLAIVVPTFKIAEVLEQPQLKEYRSRGS